MSLAVIIGSAAAMLSLYPVIHKRAEQYLQTQENQADDQLAAQNLAVRLVNASYALWQDQEQENAGRRMTPAQIFLPGIMDAAYHGSSYGDSTYEITAENDEQAISYEIAAVPDQEEELESLISYVNELGHDWKAELQQMHPHLSYQMTDETGNVLRTNVTENPEQFWKQTAPNGEFLELVMTYGRSGNLVLDSLSYHGEFDADALSDALSQYYDYDPYQSYSYDYFVIANIGFSGPKDVSYRFRVSADLLTEQDSFYSSDTWTMRMACLDTGTFPAAFFGLCGLVALAALVLPCFPSLRLGQERIFRTPCEIVLLIGMIAVSVILGTGFAFPLDLMILTFDGRLVQALTGIGLPAHAAVIVQWILQTLMWIGIFALLFWGVTCLRSVFSLGLWRYFRERTLIGRFCCFIKRQCSRFYVSLLELDWRASSTKVIAKAVLINFLLLSLISCLWFFGIAALVLYSVILFFLMKRYWKQLSQKYELLLDAINQIAQGNLDVTIDQPLGIFEPFREQLIRIQQGFKKAVETEVSSQKMKTELVTNVSHDLKTPLTAIITYVNLLKQENLTPEERDSYIQVLDQKSMRLKELIDDLFEISKANSGSAVLELMEVDIVSLMKQVRLELDDQIQASGLDFRWNLPEERLTLTLDSQKTYRIFSNLLINITKYAMPGTRAYVDITAQGGETAGHTRPDPGAAVITFRNISAAEIHIGPGELTERFVRGDASRNTEGSGLGLAIAKSFTELQNGSFTVETDADLFRVTIRFPM